METSATYLDKVQQVMDLTRAFFSLKHWIKYGISCAKCGSMPLMQPKMTKVTLQCDNN